MRSQGLRVDLNPRSGVFIRRKTIHLRRMPQSHGGRDWSDTSKSQGCYGLPVTPEARKRGGRSLHEQSLQREGHGWLIAGFWTSSLQNDERIHFCCIKATPFVLICYKKEINTMAKCFTQKTEYPVTKNDFLIVPNRYDRRKACSHTAWVQICCSLAVGSWASHFVSLYCSSLAYKIGDTITHLKGCDED